MTFFAVGLLSFALVTLWQDMDIFEKLRNRLNTLLARLGWTEKVKGDPRTLGPRKRGGIWRFMWQVITCPFCLSVYVALGASWYVVGNHTWTKAFWTLWWSAVGVAWLATVVYHAGQEAREELAARAEERSNRDDG